MIRRRRPHALALAVLLPLAAATVSSCATFDNQRVASVNDRELDQDELTQILEDPLGQRIAQSAPIDGVISGSGVRGALSIWILVEAFDEAGRITPDLVDQATQLIDGSDFTDEYASAPAAVQRLALQVTAVQVGIGNGVFSIEEISGAAAAADISVDSLYGVWDDEAASVVPMG